MPLLHALLLFSVILIWGFNFAAIKFALHGFPPIFLSFIRFFLSCFPFIFFVKRPKVPLSKILLYSLVTFVLQFSLLFSAIHTGLSLALCSILLQVQSFFAIFFAVWICGEKYHSGQTGGLLLALLGVVLVAAHIGGDITWTGLFLVLTAAALWAAGSVLAKTLAISSGFSFIVWSSFFACPPLLLLSLAFEGRAQIWESINHLEWISSSAACYIAHASTLFGFGTWIWLLQRYPLSKLAPFTLLAPIAAIGSSALLFNESLPWWKITAGSLILSGLILYFAKAKMKASNNSSNAVNLRIDG